MQLLLTITFFCLGAILASFIGVIAERAYTGQSWKRGRSKCNSCREVLHTRDLVPVFSWVAHRGRCRQCGVKLPVRYVLFESVFGGITTLAYLKLGIGVSLAVFLTTICILGFIVLYDLRHTIVPRAGSNLLILFSIAFAFISTETLGVITSHALSAVIITLFFLALHYGSRGRAMGLGDAPVAFALSLLVGSQAFAGLLFSFWIGAIIGVGILLLRKGGPKMNIEVPFVPFMAAGYLLAYFTLWNPFPFMF
jgi:leader peptidase (prepilin peptidase) / N-methyltransferase